MKPEAIYLIRHGQSEGNVDKNLYYEKPDYAVSLTDKGRQQAIDAGHELLQKISRLTYQPNVRFYHSPFWRARETHEIISTIVGRQCDTSHREDSRLIEQSWGFHPRNENNWSDEETKAERDDYGTYFYRYHNGENAMDVENRVSSFLDTLNREFTLNISLAPTQL